MLIVVRPGVWGGLLALAGLVVGTILIAFCVQHDANHGAYFRSRRFNHLLGWTADALLGFRATRGASSTTSRTTRTRTSTATTTTSARCRSRGLRRAQAPKPWYRLQHIYIWPLYSLMVLRWQTGRRHRRARRAAGSATARCACRAAGISPGIVSGKAVFVGWAIVVPLLVYPWWVVVVGYVGFTMVDGPRHRDDVPARALRRGGGLRVRGRAHGRQADLGGARGRDDGRLLPAQSRADLGARRAQLPDRASSLPARPAHALSADRRDRPAQRGEARRPLHVPAVASRRTPLASAPCARARPAAACRPRSRWVSEFTRSSCSRCYVGGCDRGARADEGLWGQTRRRRLDVHRPARRRHGLPRPERLREVDDDAADPRARLRRRPAM